MRGDANSFRTGKKVAANKPTRPENDLLDVQTVTEQYFARIHRAALVLSGNPWDADDLAQETFLVWARQADRFQGKSSVYTYLYGILLNLERRERRRHGMRRRKLRVVWENDAKDPVVPAAETAVEVTEWKRSLWSWVQKLPFGQRAVLVLRFSEGLRYDEIAKALECPLGTVKSRIFHGLSALRKMLEDRGAEARHFPAHPYEDLIHAV